MQFATTANANANVFIVDSGKVLVVGPLCYLKVKIQLLALTYLLGTTTQRSASLSTFGPYTEVKVLSSTSASFVRRLTEHLLANYSMCTLLPQALPGCLQGYKDVARSMNLMALDH